MVTNAKLLNFIDGTEFVFMKCQHVLESTLIFANAHARLHTTAVRESAALHSGKELYILGSFRQARLLWPFRICFRVYDGKARCI